uniref:F-box/LRR-repeat protein 15/At3g58940/PEG3-like LRR domain-containing protein n=1 Tax=Aegilops tauschii TaxID=37682 RepID=M8B0L4_AEGTA
MVKEADLCVVFNRLNLSIAGHHLPPGAGQIHARCCKVPVMWARALFAAVAKLSSLQHGEVVVAIDACRSSDLATTKWWSGWRRHGRGGGGPYCRRRLTKPTLNIGRAAEYNGSTKPKTRWRGLLLPGRVLRGVAFHKLEAALGRVSPAVSLLEIHVAKWACRLPPEQLRVSRVTSLLRAAARLAPEEFVLALPGESTRNTYDVELPSFHRATSIVLDALFFFKVPAGVEFPVLETLSLSGCMVDLKALLPQCPRLRVLRIKLTKFWTKGMDLMVHSASLQELVVENKWMRNVDIVAPSLKQLTMSMVSYIDKNISVMAPMMEKRWYSLLNEVDSCREAIQKHIVDAFSVLELHLETAGHVFGAFVFHLIGMNCIHSAMQRLRVVLQRSMKEGCLTNCRCDPMNWKTENMSLTALKEMEVDGFEGEDHEFDFLKLVVKSAPNLDRVTVKLSREDSSRPILTWNVVFVLTLIVVIG